MAESFFPFDAGVGASVTENEWQRMARRFLATGVIGDNYLSGLALIATGDSLTVTVQPGGAWIEGFYYDTDAAVPLVLSAAPPALPRIDTIVVRLDRTANAVTLAVVEGVAAGSPTAPTLTQTDALYDLPLYDVLRPAAQSVVNPGDLTDRRLFVRNLGAAEAAGLYLALGAKAADSDLLDGLDSTAFVRKAIAQTMTAELILSGASFANLLRLVNSTDGGAKFVRMAPGNILEIVDAAYSGVIATLSDTGALNAQHFDGGIRVAKAITGSYVGNSTNPRTVAVAGLTEVRQVIVVRAGGDPVSGAYLIGAGSSGDALTSTSSTGASGAGFVPTNSQNSSGVTYTYTAIGV